jgi:hypothetical protein
MNIRTNFEPRVALLVAGLLLALGTTGCASRAAPFNKLDKAQVTILRLQGAQAATQPTPPPGMPPLIPGIPIPPEWQAAAEQFCRSLNLPFPCTMPGQPGVTPQPQLPAYPADPRFQIADSRPVVDEKLKSKLLDILGDGDSFTQAPNTCYTPGMVVSFQDPQFPQPVDVAVSFSCQQAAAYGFQWPHKAAGLTPDTYRKLSEIYTSFFGPLPPGGA